ncbi:MAG: thiamine-monophosphate kinase [Planctomycetaceae bacterium]
MPSSTGEFDFVRRVRARAASHDRLTVPIGDDAACWEFPGPSQCLIATDMLMEGVHVSFPDVTPELAGRKSLAVNLSDIAAMAGVPLAAFVAVTFPRERGADFAERFQAGFQQLADEFDVIVAGGDTNTWDGPLVAAVTVVGEATERGPVTRSGATPGDAVFVTGELGGSRNGHHCRFTPRVREAQELHAAVNLHAMIDLSDGLASDLQHVLDESGVGAEIDAEAVPINSALASSGDGRTPLERALSDGEDFELCFTVSPQDAERLLSGPPIAVRLSRIGTIFAERGCELVSQDGTRAPLQRTGWEHGWT